MHRVSMYLGCLVIVLGCYFSVTWFFFGSHHPCGILETRQKPYVLEAAHTISSMRRKVALALLRARKNEAETMLLEGANAIPKEYLDNLHKAIWGMTPAQCAVRAIGWDVNPYKNLSEENKEFLKTLPDEPKKEAAKPNKRPVWPISPKT
jgi:hypothetical protein